MDEQRVFATGTPPRTPPEHTARLDAMASPPDAAPGGWREIVLDRASRIICQGRLKTCDLDLRKNCECWNKARSVLALASPLPVDKGQDVGTVPVELMQRVGLNLYADDNSFQGTLNDVVDWLAGHNALPDVPPPEDKGWADIAAEVPEELDQALDKFATYLTKGLAAAPAVKRPEAVGALERLEAVFENMMEGFIEAGEPDKIVGALQFATNCVRDEIHRAAEVPEGDGGEDEKAETAKFLARFAPLVPREWLTQATARAEAAGQALAASRAEVERRVGYQQRLLDEVGILRARADALAGALTPDALEALATEPKFSARFPSTAKWLVKVVDAQRAALSEHAGSKGGE